MSVQFDIMPDIQPEHRSLDYWATPSWLSITSPRNLNNVAELPQGHPGKTIILLSDDGETITFESGMEAAQAFKVSTLNMYGRLKYARQKKNNRIRYKKIWYTIQPHVGDTVTNL